MQFFHFFPRLETFVRALGFFRFFPPLIDAYTANNDIMELFWLEEFFWLAPTLHVVIITLFYFWIYLSFAKKFYTTIEGEREGESQILDILVDNLKIWISYVVLFKKRFRWSHNFIKLSSYFWMLILRWPFFHIPLRFNCKGTAIQHIK